MMKEIKLIRHGEIVEKHMGRYIGSTDIPLSETGHRSASLLAKKLEGKSHDRLISSPMTRTMETAGHLAGKIGIEPVQEPGFKEIDFGRWEGLTFSEIQEKDPKLVDRWMGLDPDFEFPGGESVKGFQNRVHQAGLRLMDMPETNILVFAHAGVIRFLVCDLLGLPADFRWSFEIDYTSVTTIKVMNDKAVLVGLNDMCHREGS